MASVKGANDQSKVNPATGSASMGADNGFSSGTDAVDFTALLGGGSTLSTVNSGFSKLFEQLTEIKKEAGDDLKAFNLKMIADPRLSAFGEILTVHVAYNKRLYVVAILPGDATVQKEYKSANNNGINGENFTVSRTIDDIVRQVGTNGERPFRTLIHDHLNDGTGLSETDVIVVNSYPIVAKQEVDIRALLRNIRFDIINYMVAVAKVNTIQATQLMGKLGELSVETTRGISLKDSLGNPQYAPIVLALSQKVPQPFGSGMAVSRVAEVRGFMDALPLSPNRAQKLRVERANAQGLPIEQVAAPRLKPIFMVRGIEWLTESPASSMEAMIALFGIIGFLPENPTWLVNSIQEKESGGVDFATVGTYATGAGDKPTPISLYHDRKFLGDSALLQAHIAKFWDNISVAIDIPLSGPGKTVLEALASKDRVNAAFVAIYGNNAKLLTEAPVVDNKGPIPVGVYNDKGVIRDTRALITTPAVATRYQGDQAAITEFLNTFWTYNTSRADAIYAARLESLQALAGNNELIIRGEDLRLVLNDEFIRVARANLLLAKTVNTHTVTAAAETVGFGDSWGDGLSHGAGATTQGNVAFTGFQSSI